MSTILQTNSTEKKARLQQLIEWGCISHKEAEVMYNNYCRLFERKTKMATAKWYVNNNLISRKLNGNEPVAKCDSHETAFEIAEAHNVDYKAYAEQEADVVLDKVSKLSGVEFFLRELQATDTDDYNVIRDRVAAIVEELKMEAAEATVLRLYEICSQIDEDVEGQYEDERAANKLLG